MSSDAWFFARSRPPERDTRETPLVTALGPEAVDDGWFSIERWMEELIGTPKESEIALLMKSLPDAVKAKYREVYKNLKEEKKNERRETR